MTPTDRLVIIETVLPARIECGDASVERAFTSDMNMLAVTGGKERDLGEWDYLMSAWVSIRAAPVEVPLRPAQPRGSGAMTPARFRRLNV